MQLDDLGERIVSTGKYAVVTMAGGQGSRLEHPGPKGTFRLDVYGKGKYLFEILIDNLKEAKRQKTFWKNMHILDMIEIV